MHGCIYIAVTVYIFVPELDVEELETVLKEKSQPSTQEYFLNTKYLVKP